MLSSGTGQGIQVILRKTVDTFIPLQSPYCYQCLRWRRKPRWLPMAPSRMFKIPPRKIYPVEETIEVMRLNNKYRTEIKSLRLYFAEKTQSMTTAPEVIEEQCRKAEEHHKKCIDENNRWNAEVAELRKVRLEQLEKDQREEIMNNLIEHEKKQKEIFEQMEALVRKEKENSKYFITEANIDEAIEKALSNPVDYDFMIDIQGNIYNGRYTKYEKPSQNQQNEIRIEAVN